MILLPHFWGLNTVQPNMKIEYLTVQLRLTKQVIWMPCWIPTFYSSPVSGAYLINALLPNIETIGQSQLTVEIEN